MYDIIKDREEYKKNHTKVLSFTRILLFIGFIVQWMLGEEIYTIWIIITASRLYQEILNYKITKYQEDLVGIIALSIAVICLIVLKIANKMQS